MISKERLIELENKAWKEVAQMEASVTAYGRALLKAVQDEAEVEYYEYRAFYGDNTVNPGWGDWERVVPRDRLCTIDDAVGELEQYISAGCKYQMRKLIALPLVESEE